MPIRKVIVDQSTSHPPWVHTPIMDRLDEMYRAIKRNFDTNMARYAQDVLPPINCDR